MTADPVWHFYAGRDYMRDGGWVVRLAVLPARRLMTKATDEGRVILAGLHLEFSVCWQSGLDRMLDRVRPRASVRAWSDADEIATRIAASAA
jgi:hypothetical protein